MDDVRFVNELASAAPTPGGGGASSYCGALASALVSMVGNLSLGKERYAAAEPQIKERLVELEKLRARLLELMDEDARAFEPLVAAYRMPKETPEQKRVKDAAMQAALKDAIAVPFDAMRTAAAVLDHAEFMAHEGNRSARSDIGVAASFVRAAVDGASLNVFINVKSLNDAERAKSIRDEAEQLAESTRQRCDELFAFVKDAIS